MTITRLRACAAVLLFAGATAGLLLAGGGEAPPTLAIAGDVPRSGALAMADLATLSPGPVEWTHKGTTHKFTGIPLQRFLGHVGIGPGEKSETVAKSEKRSGYRHVVVASAPDGFQAVFAYAELAEANNAPTKAFLVWELDGKPLPDDMGPFRIVTTTDGEGARSIQNVSRIDIVDMRRIVPPQVAQ